MLSEFRYYDYLGSPDFFFELCNTLRNKGALRYSDITSLFFNRVISGKSNFSGCVDFALKTKILLCDGDLINFNPAFESKITTIDSIRTSVVEYFFDYVRDDDEFNSILTSESVRFDVHYRFIQISNSAFGLKYANVKHFLFDFGVLINHPSLMAGIYIFNTGFTPLLEKYLIPVVHKRKISIEQFNRNIELQKIYGDQAEKFVFEFEERRLCRSDIVWISRFVVNDGYDIASYNSTNDCTLNRFIEVKSYDGDKPYFYWSKNERFVANYKKEDYWLYLVDRGKIAQRGYEPLMIQNPLSNLDDSGEWFTEIESVKYSKL